jgi:hypothetical protein
MYDVLHIEATGWQYAKLKMKAFLCGAQSSLAARDSSCLIRFIVVMTQPFHKLYLWLAIV